MSIYHLVNKKEEPIVKITVEEAKGTFRYLGKGSWGAGCGNGTISDAVKEITKGMTDRKKNSVKLIKAS